MADRKITELAAMSAGGQATGDLLTIVDVSEAAAADKNKKMTMENLFKGVPGDVGIGTSTPQHILHLHKADSGANYLQITNSTTGSGSSDGCLVGVNAAENVILWQREDKNIQFGTNDAERVRIDNDGRLAVGLIPSSTASITNVDAGLIQTDGNIDIRYAGSNTNPAGTRYVSLINTDSSLVAGQPMGGIRWVGNDSSNTSRDTASILAFCQNNTGTSSNITFNNDGGTERMRIDSSGNVNLVSSSSSLTDLNFTDSALNVFARVEGGKSGSGVGDLRFHTYSGGLSEAMRIDSSGNVGIGIANPGSFNAKAETLVLANSGDHVGITLDCDTDKEGSIYFADGGSGDNLLRGQIVYNHDGDSLRFVTNASERMRIDGSGNIGIGTTTINSRFSLNGTLRFQTGNNPIALLTGDGDGTNCFKIDSNTGVGNGSGLVRVFNNGTQKARIEGDGSFQSATNSYGAISDVSLKENIVDADIQWADIKNIQVRNFNFKEAVGHGTSTQLGVIAQEVESVSPGLVKTDSDGVKSVKYSVLYMKAVKALQEAMDRIETLEAKVAALEAQ